LKVKSMQLDWVPETDSSSVIEITSSTTAVNSSDSRDILHHILSVMCLRDGQTLYQLSFHT
jgi:hypothetical protein